MDNSDIDVSQWVDSRLASLNPPSHWRPNAARAIARLKARPNDHLDRLLPCDVEPVWFVSLWRNLRETIHPEKLPPLDITSKPLPLKDIWGLYAQDRKSMLYSVAMQSAVVFLMFSVSFNKTVQDQVRQTVTLVAPVLEPLDMQKNTLQGGGGGEDRSPTPAAKGALPKVAMKQFVPPAEVIHNEHPQLVVEPTIVAPPDAVLPNINLPNIGDPLAKLGPLSNGMGAGG